MEMWNTPPIGAGCGGKCGPWHTQGPYLTIWFPHQIPEIEIEVAIWDNIGSKSLHSSEY
jgi:hypothetical protein